MSVNIIAQVKCFEGEQIRFEHASIVNHCTMRASLYLPPQAEKKPVPLLYWLSGLTCTDENFVTKAGAQQYAAAHGVGIVAADTSPRGNGVPDDEQESYDFGLGAGFYVSATQAPWSTHYHMYEYILNELPGVVQENFPVDKYKRAIFGHSMGGHGALTIALNNPQHYCSVSAFAPICSPMNCPWGKKALTRYIGDDPADWQRYDACHLVRHAIDKKFHLRIEQGGSDAFLEEQLKPDLLTAACKESGYPFSFHKREGYDHSYYFIASFIGEHIAFHANALHR